MEARGWKKRWYRIQVRGPIARRIMVGHDRAGRKPFADVEDDMVVDCYGPMATKGRRDPDADAGGEWLP
jgi:hypothetical protein